MLFGFSLLCLLLTLVAALEVVLGMHKMLRLAESPTVLPANPPKVSLIFAALNEASTIEPSLRSMLALDYPNLEIIAVNDRSADSTGAIMDRLALEHPHLHVVHIDTLPAGWLGKNHALHRGTEMASGDYLLFTDADVHFAPDCLRRAVNWCEQQQVDHLTLLIKIIASGTLLQMVLASMLVDLWLFVKPWKINTSTRNSFGCGAFNMVRRTVYQSSGGLAALPLEVIDDIGLGKRFNDLGFRQHMLDGRESVAVEWYPDTQALFNGLKKNAFCMFDYSIGKLLAGSLLALLLLTGLGLGLSIGTGSTPWLVGLTFVFGLALHTWLLRDNGWSYRALLYAPAIPLIKLAVVWYGALAVLWRRGVIWRGTFYPLAELKRAHKPLR